MAHKPVKQQTTDLQRKSGTAKVPAQVPDRGTGAKTLCLTMIVKNESKNMVRLLESLKGVIDFISIVDTGSSDNTRQVIQNWGKKHHIPTTVHTEVWKNFGYNRTHSVVMAQQTYPQADYLLLSDADFVWETNGKFDKRLLFENSYLVDQYNDVIRYANTRLLSSKLAWECVGVTHEFWRAVDKGNQTFEHTKVTSLVIKDIGDGGAKGDKFERDERLLRGGLKDPNTPDDIKTRYKFYLAETLHNIGKYEESIVWYTERVKDVGFVEETYYSIYKIGKNHEQIAWHKRHLAGQMANAEKGAKTTEGTEAVEGTEAPEANVLPVIDPVVIQRWNPDNLDSSALTKEGIKNFDMATNWYRAATEYRPQRAEALYALTKMLRTLGLNEQAYKAADMGRKIPYPKDDKLFVEHAVYHYLFDYEISIVAYYIPDKRDEGREACLRLLSGEQVTSEVRNLTQRNSKFYL